MNTINDRWDETEYTVTCECGAVYKIRETDGTPGCRDVKSVCCEYCDKELASHFGDCDGTLIDDSKVSEN